MQRLPRTHGYDGYDCRMVAPMRKRRRPTPVRPQTVRRSRIPIQRCSPTPAKRWPKRTRVIHGVPRPNVDIKFDDVWTDPNVRAKDASFAYAYSALTTPPPVDPGCVANWTASCRIVVNYETSIHPLWGVPRLAADGVTNATCNSCHSPTDAMGAAQVPAAQLDLSDGASPDEAAQFNSYRELLFSDNQQEVVNGALVDRLVQATDANGNPLFQMDGNGNLILDANGQPIPVLVNVTTSAPMSAGGALASPRFFSRFNAGRHARGLADACRIEADLGMAGHWRTVFQRPVCGTSGLTTHLRRARFVFRLIS